MEIKNFLFKVPKSKIVNGRIDTVINMCKDKTVLHLGCVDEGLTINRIDTGELLHLKIMKVAKATWGLDISEEGLDTLRTLGIKNLIWGDVENLESTQELKNKEFDIILACEIIEHLNNPTLFLKSVKNLFSKNTLMILTTPNAFRFSQLKYSLKGCELVHPDHNYWFSWKTLSTLLIKNGYRIEETLVYSFAEWRLGSLKNNIREEKSCSFLKTIIGFLIRRYLYKKNPFFADGLIFVVRPQHLET